MPLYRFNIHNGNGLTEDEEGRDLPDDESAPAEAISGIRSILAEDILTGMLDLEGRIEVLDEAGRLSMTIPFTDAVTVRGDTAQNQHSRRFRAR